MRKPGIVFVVAFFLTLQQVSLVNAQVDKFITVVNPVRVAPYSGDISENLAAQYQITRKLEIPATWLVTYDVLINEAATQELLNFDKSQEIGLFLEVTKTLANDSGVVHHEGAWQFSNVVFLSGYTQDERVRLIDTLFGRYHDVFGTYPKSVGSWWTDSYSLKYMYEKYGIVANLTVADQFSTDRYQVWGQYWAFPFYPSKYHSAIPASSQETKLPVVMLQWAPRDPINGYYSSLFSTQDYYTNQVNESISYFKKLMTLYLDGPGEFGQVTIGLEGDLTADVYQGNYKNWLTTAKEFAAKDSAKTLTMSDFGDWYKTKYPLFSPAHLIHTKDLLGKDKEVVWYQNPRYRIGVLSENDKNSVKIFDLRVYDDKFVEPYYEWPNRSYDLKINVPSIYDEVSDYRNVLTLNGSLQNLSKNDDGFSLELTSGNKIILSNSNVEVVNSSAGIVQSIKPAESIQSYIFRDLSPEASHLLESKKVIAGFAIILFLAVYALYKYRSKKLIIAAGVACFLLGLLFYFRATRLYVVSQAEIDALRKLRSQEAGRVLVYDNECLQCESYGELRPAALANRRTYIESLTGKRMVANRDFFEEKDRKQAKRIFSKLQVDYIYLVGYGYYMESLPVSPGDINVEKIYSNANAELWRVKND